MRTNIEAARKLTGEKRREAGRNHFTKLLSYLLKDISHPEMTALADWALDEDGCLHTSQLSHLRNARMRMLGVRSLDALGRINQAAALYHANDRQGLLELGTARTSAKIEEILSRYTPVIHEGKAMDAGDLMRLYLGYVHLEIFAEADAERDWEKVSANLGDWIEALLDERSLRTREALAMIKKDWIGSDADRDQFCLVVAGVETIAAKDLPDMWPSITAALKTLTDDDMKESDLYEMVIA